MINVILKAINSSTGITHEELMRVLIRQEYDVTPNLKQEICNIIDDLVRKGKVVRVQYVIPPDTQRMRSSALYLPERSVVIVNAQNDRTHFKSQR